MRVVVDRLRRCPGGPVGGADAGGPQVLPDRLPRLVEAVLHPAQRIGDGAFGDRQAEQFARHPSQPLETDMVAVVEVEQQSPDARPERRPRSHARRGLGPVAFAALPASAAEQLDPRHLRADRRQIDVIVAVTAGLPPPGDIRPAMPTALRHPPLRLVRLLGERAGNPRPRRTQLAATGAIALPVPASRAVLRGRWMRVRRRLLRLGERRLKFRDPRRHTLNHGRRLLQLLLQQGILLGVSQVIARPAMHTSVDSHPGRQGKPFLPTR